MEVIFLAYANSRQNPLSQLEDEYKDVYGILIDNDVHDSYHIHPDPFCTVRTVNDYLDTFSGDIALFNYSGHAGSDKVILDDRAAHAGSIIAQLKKSAGTGSLKLVVLNGCSTMGQVKGLREAGVPAVVATSAPVEDHSALEFARRFYDQLFTKDATIRTAFNEGLAAAALGGNRDLGSLRQSEEEEGEAVDPDRPVWGLYGDDDVLDSNPFASPPKEEEEFVPNVRLFDKLFEVFLEAGNPAVIGVAERMKQEIVEDYQKRDAVLYSIPFPIAANLSNLVNVQASEKSYKDREDYKRRYLMQVGQLYHTASEFMGFIMIAQLWEIKLKFCELPIPEGLRKMLKDYFYMDADSRKVYDYLPLIQDIRAFVQKTSVLHEEIRLFVDEQIILRDILLAGDAFAHACSYLLQLHKEAREKKKWRNINKKCITAEERLCDFFSELGFLYKYHLTSITQIDILKYRHEEKQKTRFKHRIIKLMRPMKNNEERTYTQYFMPTFLDNWGVVLIKSKGEETIRDPLAREIDLDKMEFLNLSLFVVDRIVYEDNTNVPSLHFFKQYYLEKDMYEFIDASCAYKDEDPLQVTKPSPATKKRYERESICLQFKAFRKVVLGEV